MQNCFQDGEASLAVRKELAQGPVFVSSLGYTLAYNTLDSNKSSNHSPPMAASSGCVKGRP